MEVYGSASNPLKYLQGHPRRSSSPSHGSPARFPENPTQTARYGTPAGVA